MKKIVIDNIRLIIICLTIAIVVIAGFSYGYGSDANPIYTRDELSNKIKNLEDEVFNKNYTINNYVATKEYNSTPFISYGSNTSSYFNFSMLNVIVPQNYVTINGESLVFNEKGIYYIFYVIERNNINGDFYSSTFLSNNYLSNTISREMYINYSGIVAANAGDFYKIFLGNHSSLSVSLVQFRLIISKL